MSIAYEPRMNFPLPSDTDKSHGPELRTMYGAIATIMASDNLFFVSAEFTDANLNNALADNRRHFSTIQAAVTAAEGVGYSHRAMVVVLPGVYWENVVTNGSVTIAGLFPPIQDGLGGGRGVYINGTTTGLLPTIRINPTGSSPTAVNFINLSLGNGYNQANGVEITEPYLIDITKPVGYTERLYFGMKGVQSRMQTSGADNTWLYGVKADGWVEMAIRDCDFKPLAHAGGTGVGGIKNLFYLRGDSPNHDLSFGGKNINVAIEYTGTLFPALFNIDGGVRGAIGRSQLPDNVILQKLAGSTGTNSILGLEGTTIEQYGNLVGVDLSWF